MALRPMDDKDNSFSRRDFFRDAAVALPALGLSGSVAQAQGPAAAAPGALLTAREFGAVGDGVADDTDALAALLAAMQRQGRPGLLGGNGAVTRYAVRTGTLDWTFANDAAVPAPGLAGPTLFTAGRVILVARAGGPDGPFLSIRNDPRRGGRFVHGGYLGPLSFEDRTRDRAPARHGLQLCGVEAMVFGALMSEHLQGDLVHIAPRGDLLTGDGWHVSHCTFEALTTWNTQGWTLNNDGLSQFFNFNQIGMLWNIGGGKGLWRGPGAANWCRGASAGHSRGWAVDWTANQGNVQLNVIEQLELDGPEFGVRVNGVNGFRLPAIRVVHRYREEGGQRDDAASAWPRVAISLGGRTGQSTTDGRIAAFHYLKTGITAATAPRLGLLVDLNGDDNVERVSVENGIVPVLSGYAYPEERLIGNLSPNADDVDVRFNGEPYARSVGVNALIARAQSGRLPAGGAGKLALGLVQVDQGANFDRGASEYRVPARGLYRLAAQVLIDARRGEAVRIALQLNGSALIRETRAVAGGGLESFRVECVYPLDRGDRIAMLAASDAGAALAAGSIDIPSNTYLEVYQL